ncbi:MAG: Gfo/Idh/MocA family protein [Limisphaerales bacterium]
MTTKLNRRSFLKTATVAGAAVAATPGRLLAADGQVTLALVGCAHIHTPGFVNLLKGRADVKVKHVWDPDARRAERWARELGCPVTSEVDAIWSDAEVRGVVICSETTRHPALVASAARAKKHLFVEKPLGVTARESFVMAKQIEDAGLWFTTGYFMRTDPKHLFLREQIAKGAFGKITRAAAWNCHSGSLGGWFDEKPDNVAESWRWMADPKVSGVGAFGDLGTHSLDILMWLMGDVESVAADIQVVTGRYGPTCDENGQSMIKFKGGVMGALTAGWVDVANPVSLMISGTEGHAVIVRDQLYFKAKGFDDREPLKNLPKGPALPLHQFVDAVAGKADQPLVTPREAAARVAVMEAMYKSDKTGRWTKVG